MAEFITTLAGAALENVEGAARAESQLIASSVAGLAHAIKNPVAVLRAYVGLLRSGADRGDRAVVDHYLHTMEGALDRIGELVRHLQRVQVTASRKTAMPLERLIDEAIEEVGPLFPEASGYRVECDVASNAPALIVADGEQLRLVIVNLLVNANQAMPRGGCVRIAVRPASGGGVEIVITDEGAGIPSAIEPRLFEPFVTSKSEGTGLGLWVCKKIVEERHQGRIEVIGVPGGGTSVSVTLPVGQREGMSSTQ
jgi:two-component system sensor histidine kinase AtoS